jgi:hypothetical protein
MKKALRVFGLMVVLGLVASFGILYGIQEAQYRNSLAPKFDEIRGRLDSHLKDYLEDKRAVAALSEFTGFSQERDAGSFLNPMVEWVSDDQKYRRPASGAFVLPADIKEKLVAWGVNDVEHFDEIDYSRLDMTWLGALGRFDHWNLERNSPIEALYTEEVRTKKMEPYSFAVSQPYPSLRELVFWARLRWMRAARDGSFLAASLETRHLARLVFSTETILGGLMGTAILGAEVLAHKTLKERNFKLPPEWVPMSNETKRRIGRFVSGSADYFSPLAAPAMLKAAFIDPPNSSLACGGISEGIRNQSVGKSALSMGLPLERNFRETYALLDEVISLYKTKCRLTYADVIWNNPRAIALLEAVNRDPASHKTTGTSPWFLYFPYTRSIFAGNMVSNSASNFLKRYDSSATAEQ